MRSLLVALLALAFAAPAAAADETVADAGSLRAVLQSDPWRLTFVDVDGRTVLRDATGDAGRPGTLGFRAGGTWRQAVRLEAARREGEAWIGEAATDDPAGRRLQVRIAPAGEGVLAVEARVAGAAFDLDAYGAGFSGREGERYLGFGERSDAAARTGGTVESYVADGPYQAEEYPFLQAFIPVWGLRERDDSTYFPIPWLLSTAGYGVLVDNPETTLHHLGADGWRIELVNAPATEAGAEGAPAPESLRLRVFAGPRPADALRRFTAATGRQPAPTAPWTFGPWVQPTGAPAQEILGGLRKADAPLSVAQTYLHYLPCGDQRGRREGERKRTAELHALGVAVTTYLNPMICSSYTPEFDRFAAAGALTRTQGGDPYLYRYSTDSQFLVGQFDFFRPAGRDAFAEIMREPVEDGYDGWMEDFGEYTPLDSRSGDGLDGPRAHNPYATEYHCAAREIVQRFDRPIERFQRSGWTGSARCAQVVWGGDPTTSWGFDGLRSAVRQALSIGASGISRWGSDIGGFFALGTNRLTDELLKRWVQLGAVSGVMRTQANGIAVPEKERPQVWDDDQVAHWRRYAKLRTQLYPYLVAADAEYRRTGMPVMRQLALVHPDDPAARAAEDEFLLGDDLLVAPVLEPDQRERRLHVPAGRWVDLWRSVAYREDSGGLRLRAARNVDGGAAATLPAPLDELPLLARAGSVIPLLRPDVDTLAGYGDDDRSLVTLRDRRAHLDLLAFPRGPWAGRLHEGGRIRSAEKSRRWVLRVDRPRRKRKYRIQASTATLRRPFHVCGVKVNGRTHSRRWWSYDRSTRVLDVRFRRGTFRLVASACRRR